MLNVNDISVTVSAKTNLILESNLTTNINN